MKMNRPIYRKPALMLLAVLLAGACKKADKAYEKLLDIPELELSSDFIYNGSYVIGDTMVMYGRLNPSKNDFKVKIGSAVAPMIAWRNLPADSLGVGGSIFQQGLDEVKLKITSALGAGEKREVWVTSGGLSIQGPSVDILTSSPDTVSFSYDLKTTLYYYLPEENTKVFYCVNGKGSIYLYESGVIRSIRNHRATTVLSTFEDQYGSFTINTMYSGGVDFHERFLYFSARTDENNADGMNNYIYRLCRYDLETRELTSINRTLVPRRQEDATLDRAYFPFEGEISKVKLPAVGGIYPDSSGNIVMNVQHIDHTFNMLSETAVVIAYLRADGMLKYIFRKNDYHVAYYNPEAARIENTYNIPGVSIPGNTFRISPNEKLMYLFAPVGWTNTSYSLYDLTTTDMTASFTSKDEVSGWMLHGPFSSLIYRDGYSYGNFYSHFPLPGKRLLMMLTQWVSGEEYKTLVLNFGTKTSTPYAPTVDVGDMQPGSYAREPVLNYDQQGHLYIYDERIREILKTEKK